MKYLGASGPGVNSPNVKRIHYTCCKYKQQYYLENIKNGTKALQAFHTFSKEHYKNKKDKNLLTECHTSKKRKSY